MQDEMFDQQIDARIEQLRSKFGQSREALAEKLGISWQHLSNIEKGRRRITLDLLLKLRAIYQVSLDYLIFGVDEPNDLSDLMAMLSGMDKNMYPHFEEILISFIKALYADRNLRE